MESLDGRLRHLLAAGRREEALALLHQVYADDLVRYIRFLRPTSSIEDTTASNKRAFDFANLASEAVSGIEVYKTSRASTRPVRARYAAPNRFRWFSR